MGVCGDLKAVEAVVNMAGKMAAAQVDTCCQS